MKLLTMAAKSQIQPYALKLLQAGVTASEVDCIVLVFAIQVNPTESRRRNEALKRISSTNESGGKHGHVRSGGASDPLTSGALQAARLSASSRGPSASKINTGNAGTEVSQTDISGRSYDTALKVPGGGGAAAMVQPDGRKAGMHARA